MILISNQDGGNKVSLTYKECQAKLREYKALNYSIPALNSKKSVLEDAIEEISHQILLNTRPVRERGIRIPCTISRSHFFAAKAALA